MRIVFSESLVLTPSGCELSTTRASHADAGDLTPARNSTYLEKVLCYAHNVNKLKIVVLCGKRLFGRIGTEGTVVRAKSCERNFEKKLENRYLGDSRREYETPHSTRRSRS